MQGGADLGFSCETGPPAARDGVMQREVQRGHCAGWCTPRVQRRGAQQVGTGLILDLVQRVGLCGLGNGAGVWWRSGIRSKTKGSVTSSLHCFKTEK